MGRTTLNIKKDIVLISPQAHQQSLFLTKQEETGTKIALYCSESSNLYIYIYIYIYIFIYM